MDNARQIKQRISTAKNIAKITKAMEMVSASKMRKAQDNALATRPYNQALYHSLRTLADATDITDHPLLTEPTTGTHLCVLLSTDKGLCGGLNTNLIKRALEWHDDFPEGEFVILGRKGVASAKILGLPVHAQFIDLPQQADISSIAPLRQLLLEGFSRTQYRTVTLLYTDFISTLVQKTTLQQVLPLPKLEPADEPLTDPMASEYVFEPSSRAILDEMLPYYLENALFQAMLESKASEHSARMVSMKNASENAVDLQKELKLRFNKSRQASITAELLDIVTATLSQNP